MCIAASAQDGLLQQEVARCRKGRDRKGAGDAQAKAYSATASDCHTQIVASLCQAKAASSFWVKRLCKILHVRIWPA